MYEFKYPARGHTAVSQRIIELLEGAKIPVREDSEHGLDHGTWSPLSIVFPKADIPIIQVSLESSLDPSFHLQVGRALAPLQYEDVLVIGSGSATHNLRDFRGATAGQVAEYAVEFDGFLRDMLTSVQGEERSERLRKIMSHPHARRAHPSTEHLAPVFVAAGAGYDFKGASLHEDMVHGALSMACYSF